MSIQRINYITKSLASVLVEVFPSGCQPIQEIQILRLGNYNSVLLRNFINDMYILLFRSYMGSRSLCSSTNTGPDNCTITTSNESFYIQVFAFSALNRAILTIKGRNFANVSKIREPEMTTEMTTVLPYRTETIGKFVFYITYHFLNNIIMASTR